MKGDPLSIVPPRNGFRTDQPPYLLPADSLRAGLNVMLDEDGVLKTRLGYLPLSAQPMRGLPHPVPLARRAAAVAWRSPGQANLVLADLTRWWSFASGAWQDLSGTSGLLSGSITAASRLVQFAYGQQTIGTTVYSGDVVYGVNGATQDPLHRWVVGAPQYEPVVPRPVPSGSMIPPFAAADCAVVASRLVAVAPNPYAGQNNSRTVIWSVVNDGTTYSPLAFNQLEGETGTILAVVPGSLTAAVLYCERGAYLMSGVPGDDASAFVFNRIPGVVVGPYSPQAVANVAGTHYFLARDNRVWATDGSSAQPISAPIDAFLRSGVASGVTIQQPVALYDSDRQRIIWFVAFEGDTDTRSAISLNLVTGQWEAPWSFAAAVTVAVPLTELEGYTWDTIPDAYATWNLIGWTTWNAIPDVDDPAVYIATADGRVHHFATASTDNGQPIPWSATWAQRRPQNPAERYAVDTVELLLAPLGAGAALVRLTIEAFATPYDPTPAVILSAVVDPADPTTWLQQVPPSLRRGAFLPGNILQFQLEGLTADQVRIAGATVFTSREGRQDAAGASLPL